LRWWCSPSFEVPAAAPRNGTVTATPPARSGTPTASSATSPTPDPPTETASDAGSSEEPSVDRPSPEEVAILEAYQGYWDATREANNPPNENHPALRRYATGEAYESVFNAAQTNRLAGRAVRLPENSISEHHAEVVSVDGDTATVRDCSINDGLVVDVETGEVVNDEVVTRLGTGTLVREDGRWKVATTAVEQTWEGVAGCAVAD